MDRLSFITQNGQANWGLIKLRDIPKNYWNVDNLYILTDTLDEAKELQRIAEEEEWRRKDPIDRFRKFLQKQGIWTETYEKETWDQAREVTS